MSNKRGGNIENIKVHMCKNKITIEITSFLIESRMAVEFFLVADRLVHTPVLYIALYSTGVHTQ